MNGPFHYAEAERLIEIVEISDSDGQQRWGALNLSLAQVHATLALAAATGLDPIDADTDAWREVAG